MMDVCGRRFVLTGGASELTGLSELARRVIARNVRIGRPVGISACPKSPRGPPLPPCRGMLVYPQVCGQEFAEPHARRSSSPAPTAISPASAAG